MNSTVEVPLMIGYKDVIKLFLKNGKSLPYSTLSHWVNKNRLRKGIYVGGGFFNMRTLSYYLDKGEPILKRGQ